MIGQTQTCRVKNERAEPIVRAIDFDAHVMWAWWLEAGFEREGSGMSQLGEGGSVVGPTIVAAPEQRLASYWVESGRFRAPDGV